MYIALVCDLAWRTKAAAIMTRRVLIRHDPSLRPSVYVLGYTWHLNCIGIYTREAFIRGNMVHHIRSELILANQVDQCQLAFLVKIIP